MRDLIEQINTHLWVILHHRWLAIIAAFLICLLGWVTVEFLPDKYEVETKVFFDTKTVLTPLLEGLAVDNTVREDAALVMRRTLISRPNLLKVAQETEMDLTASNPEELDDVLSVLANNLHINAVSIGKNKRDENLYRISYENTDPKLAKKVVESVLSIFIENVLGSSRKDSDKAERFLDEKILEYQKKLESAEDRLKIFKQKNPSLTQENEATFFQRLNTNKSKLEEANLVLREEQNKNFALKKQLQELLEIDTTVVPSNQNTQIEQTPLEKRIESIQLRLDELQLQFTDKHPDVISTKRILEDLLLQQENEKEVIVSETGEQISPQEYQISNSVFFQELKLLISESDSEIAAIEARTAEYQNKIDEMSNLISVIPEIEAELVRLNRDYSIIKSTYDNLVKRKASAQISREAEQTGGELQFKIIEPPRIPFKPASPDRILLSTGVLLGGLLFGALIAWVYEQFNPSFYTVKQIEDNYDLEVYGSINMNWSKSELSGRRIGITFYVLIVLSLVSAYMVLMVHHGIGTNYSDYLKLIK